MDELTGQYCPQVDGLCKENGCVCYVEYKPIINGERGEPIQICNWVSSMKAASKLAKSLLDIKMEISEIRSTLSRK